LITTKGTKINKLYHVIDLCGKHFALTME